MRSDFFTLVSVKSFDSTRRSCRRQGRPVRDVEDMPHKVSMRTGTGRRWSSYTQVTRSKPLTRWLLTQVGRQWSEVYSAASRQFDCRTDHGRAMLEWLRNRVDTDTLVAEDGSIRVRATTSLRYNSRAERGNTGYTEDVSDFYVHPTSGALQYRDLRVGRIQAEKAQAATDLATNGVTRVIVSKTRQLHKLGGQWYWVELAPITPPKFTAQSPVVNSDGSVRERAPLMDYQTVCRDVVLCLSLEEVPVRGYNSFHTLTKQYGTHTHYAKAKYQASSADIRRHVKQP